MDYAPLIKWLKGQVIRFVLDGPHLPGRSAEILFNWAMSEYNPTPITQAQAGAGSEGQGEGA